MPNQASICTLKEKWQFNHAIFSHLIWMKYILHLNLYIQVQSINERIAYYRQGKIRELILLLWYNRFAKKKLKEWIKSNSSLTLDNHGFGLDKLILKISIYTLYTILLEAQHNSLCTYCLILHQKSITTIQ